MMNFEEVQNELQKEIKNDKELTALYDRLSEIHLNETPLEYVKSGVLLTPIFDEEINWEIVTINFKIETIVLNKL